ncbi:transmembrane protein 9-like protein [Dinothrombium tinctorium]|uniref:Transmembrane protein 9-like protein n=1 Tax=Dinothrombium tinctorium TaxID=1965070 RepID=A0A3S3NKA3_9ACAR|nr:transmembrane protein 9-like protein [Dinothrombium tinctorium]
MNETLKRSTRIFLFIFALLLCLQTADAQYEDARCKCICPSPSVVSNTSEEYQRKLYIDNVSPQDCNCDGIVLPQMTQEIKDKAKEFCPRCECKYESRRTNTIKWVVIFIVGIIAFLVVYMCFLMLLEPFLHKGHRSAYQEQINEELSLEEQTASGSINSSRKRILSAAEIIVATPQNNVLNRVNQQQNKWKKQVQEQRKNIYDRHTMLN